MRSPRRILVLSMLLGWSFFLHAQPNPWSYQGKISFPLADSIAARPYLCAIDESGRLYVISSRVDDPRAHNAIFFANRGDTLFTKMIDYDLNGDSDTLTGNIGALRGIATLKNDLVVIASQPYPKTKPNTLAAAYYYRNRDTSAVERFGWGINGAGYGSFIQGCDMSRDSMLVTGIDFGTSTRWYNWGYRYKKSTRGSWNPPDTTNLTIFSNATEPGGPQTSGLDLIRDVALVPEGNYFDGKTAFYTSRNSLSSTQQTGGIAVWTGGTQVLPISYTPNRITDFDLFLSFPANYPYGITVDMNGYLWVAGVDTTRRWVKGFQVDGVNAVPVLELPSQTSMDVSDPAGAPMLAPSDVAFDRNGSFAYVIDRYARCAFIFKKGATDVQTGEHRAMEIRLAQNYPNPFNPSTIMSYTLAQAGRVRLTVTDILGREVRTLVDGSVGAGTHTVVFRGDDLPGGVYFYSLTTPTSRATKKMLLLK